MRILHFLTIIVFIIAQPAFPLTIRFLNVGHGDAILISTDSGKKILIDSGLPDKNFIRKYIPGKKISLLILTHTDLDHCGNFPRLLRRCRIRRLAEPGYPSGTPLYPLILRLARRKNIPICWPVRGTILPVDRNTRLQFLNPPESLFQYTKADANNNSLVFILHYGKHRVLFTGDAEKTALRDILNTYTGLRFEYLKVPHHGSKTGFLKELYTGRNLKAAIISCSEAARRKSPLSLRLLRLARKNGIRIMKTTGCRYIELKLVKKNSSLKKVCW